MPVHESFRAYTQSVCDQIRWKRARPMIAKELEDHLCDQCEAYQRAGQNEESAVQESVRQMGDPIALGADFDRTHRPKAPWMVILLAAVILLAGFFLREPLGLNGGEVELSDWIALGLSIALCAGAYFLDISFLGRFALPLSWLPLLGGYVLSFIGTASGRGLYFDLFHIAVDLKYLALLAPLSFALLLYALRGRGYGALGWIVLGYLAWSFLLWGVPTGGGWLLYSLIAFALLMMAVLRGWLRVRKAPVVAGIVFCALLGFSLYLLMMMRNEHLYYAIWPELDPHNKGWFGMWVRELLGNAQAFGVGAPLSYRHSSVEGLALAKMVYCFGWVPAVVIVLLVVLFAVGLLRLSLRQSSVQGRLVALAISLTFVLETAAFFLNNFFLTLTPLAVLPLFAGANDALVLHGILLGFLLSVFRSEPLLLDRFTPLGSGISKRICWEDGKLTIDFRA